jgi:chromosomal replication initiation ATPase DnaA
VSKAYPGTRKLDVKAGGAGGPDADGQGALDLGFRHRRALGRDDFILSDSNAAAARIVAAPRCWPGGRLALIGPEGSGKTHLARCFMAETGAACVEAPALRDPDVPALLASGGVAVESADRLAAPEAERALFHLMNFAAAEEKPILLTGREAPARWPAALPDLASRLSALPIAALAPPDDALLEAVIAKHFADRSLQVEPGLPAYLARRIERSFAAAAAAVDALDAASLVAKRKPSRRLAAAALDL